MKEELLARAGQVSFAVVSHLLHKLSTNTKHCSVQELLLSILPHSLEATRLRSLTLFINSVLNLRNGTANRLVVLGDGLGILSYRPKNLSGLVVMVVVNEPTRRLGKEKNTDEGQDGEEDLEGEREAELGVVADKGHAIVNPV